MCGPFTHVTLSVISHSPRFCHFGRPSPALPENPAYPENENAGRLEITGSCAASRPFTPACDSKSEPCPWKYAVDRYSPYIRLIRSSCTIEVPKFDVNAPARLKAGPQSSVAPSVGNVLGRSSWFE